jgi:hypothetical protein
MRVTVLVQGVPQEVADPESPFVLFALLQHEHKRSALNFTVQRNTEYEESVRSKVYLFLFHLSFACLLPDSPTGCSCSLCWSSSVASQSYLQPTHSWWREGREQCPQIREIPPSWCDKCRDSIWACDFRQSTLRFSQGDIRRTRWK